MTQSKQQPDVTTALMDALNYLLEQTVDQLLADGDELSEGERAARDKAICALADAHQARRHPKKDLVADIHEIASEAVRREPEARVPRDHFFIAALSGRLQADHPAASEAVFAVINADWACGGAA